ISCKRGKPDKNIVRFPNGKFQHLGRRRNILQKRLVANGEGGILRREDIRLPSEVRKIFHKLKPALYATSPRRWPIVSNDENFLFHATTWQRLISTPDEDCAPQMPVSLQVRLG